MTNRDDAGQACEGKEREGLLGRLFRRGKHEAPGPKGTARNKLNLADVQWLVLRGHRMPMVRHILLQVGEPAAARRLLGRLVSGDETDVPQITTAEDWQVGLDEDRDMSGFDFGLQFLDPESTT